MREREDEGKVDPGGKVQRKGQGRLGGWGRGRGMLKEQ